MTTDLSKCPMCSYKWEDHPKPPEYSQYLCPGFDDDEIAVEDAARKQKSSTIVMCSGHGGCARSKEVQ